MKKYRKKPVVIQALTFDELVEYGKANGGNIVNGMPWSFDFVARYIGESGIEWERKSHVTHENDDFYIINTLEGDMMMTREDMLIIGVKGEIYPCRIDIFNATYEEAE